MTEPRPPYLRIRIHFPGGSWIGPGKADLLQGIAETGSILAAGKRMGMSYRRAWGLVDAMNAMFSEPLVTASRGGSDRGGAALTDTGAEVLRLYRSALDRASAAADADMAGLAAIRPKDTK
jgi:molybdate transport system regulatory protein